MIEFCNSLQAVRSYKSSKSNQCHEHSRNFDTYPSIAFDTTHRQSPSVIVSRNIYNSDPPFVRQTAQITEHGVLLLRLKLVVRTIDRCIMVNLASLNNYTI